MNLSGTQNSLTRDGISESNSALKCPGLDSPDLLQTYRSSDCGAARATWQMKTNKKRDLEELVVLGHVFCYTLLRYPTLSTAAGTTPGVK